MWFSCTFISNGWCFMRLWIKWDAPEGLTSSETMLLVLWGGLFFLSKEAILHLRWIFFFLYSVVILSAWPNWKKNNVVPKCSRDIAALLFMWSCVTHCACGRLRWSYCEFGNCHPRPLPVPWINYQPATHVFRLYSLLISTLENKAFLWFQESKVFYF